MHQYFKDTISKLPSQRQAEGAGLPQEEEESNEVESEEEGTDDPHESDLLLLRIQRILLPLLMKEEILDTDFWAPDVDSAAVRLALDSIVTDLRQHRDGSLSVARISICAQR
jgi:hypothetical protein